MKQKKASSIVITFYVISVLLLLVFMFMTWLVYDSIKLTMDQYSMSFTDIWGEMWQSIINMFMTQSLPWLVYAIITYGIGCIINKVEENASVSASDAQCNESLTSQEAKDTSIAENANTEISDSTTEPIKASEPTVTTEKETAKKESADTVDQSQAKPAKKRGSTTAKKGQAAKKKTEDTPASKTNEKAMENSKEIVSEGMGDTPVSANVKESAKADAPATETETSESTEKDA